MPLPSFLSRRTNASQAPSLTDQKELPYDGNSDLEKSSGADKGSDIVVDHEEKKELTPMEAAKWSVDGDESPFPEVQACVSTEDDPTLEVNSACNTAHGATAMITSICSLQDVVLSHSLRDSLLRRQPVLLVRSFLDSIYPHTEDSLYSLRYVRYHLNLCAPSHQLTSNIAILIAQLRRRTAPCLSYRSRLGEASDMANWNEAVWLPPQPRTVQCQVRISMEPIANV